jgi:hypothetical protein
MQGIRYQGGVDPDRRRNAISPYDSFPYKRNISVAATALRCRNLRDYDNVILDPAIIVLDLAIMSPNLTVTSTPTTLLRRAALPYLINTSGDVQHPPLCRFEG